MADTRAFAVDPSNADSLAAWDGSDGEYWAEQEDYFERSLHHYDDAFFTAAAIAPHDRVLDVGCGTGCTTRHAARAALHGQALGIDLSSRMLAHAHAAADGLTNVTFLQADAQVHRFDDAAFDVAISRTGTMFFGDPLAAFSNIGRALGRDGRFAQLVWQSTDENEWFIDFRHAVAAGRDLGVPPADVPGPFSFADPDRITSLLDAAGFVDVHVEGHAGPMVHGLTPDEAFRNVSGMGFVGFMLHGLDDTSRAEALSALRASIDAHSTPDGVLYASAVWIVSARRR